MRRLAFLFTILVGCRGADTPPDEHAEHEGDHGEPHVDEPAHGELPKTVRLPKDVAAAAGIIVAPVRREQLVRTVELVGEIAAEPDRVARVPARISGSVASVEFKAGDRVRAGQRLVSIRAPDLGELRANKRSLGARIVAARAEVERLEALEAKRLAARQDVVAAKAELGALEADLTGASQQLAALDVGRARGKGTGELAVVAPSGGVVLTRDVVVGDPVQATSVLGTIAALDEVYFDARVFERDLGKLAVGASAEVVLGAWPGTSFVGTVEHLGYAVDERARTIVARIRLKNEDDRLRIGLFGSARVAIDEPTAAPATLVVPRSAITQIDGESHVFVAHPDGDYELHKVLLGDSSPGRVEIVHGLREGEQVVTGGVFTLKSTLLRGTFAEEHGH
ncbi:MAG TPA: efflux RND transporter periplasmic adaptor subunit [Nannocystaceae bacterium]|nr:efflux RND transporter periplasmic adaptor subunit [Nannocystaceae bacterium]